MRQVFVDQVISALTELSDSEFQSRVWTGFGKNGEMSSLEECMGTLFDDSGLDSALGNWNTVFDPIIDAQLEALGGLLVKLEQETDPSNVLEHPWMEIVRERATKLKREIEGGLPEDDARDQTISESRLTRKLRERRYGIAIEASAEVLVGISVPRTEQRPLDLIELEAIWPQFLSRLRDGRTPRKRWPADHLDDVQHHIYKLRDAVGDLAVIWIAIVRAEPVAIELPADQMLDAATGYLATRSGDLYLTTRDQSSGFCLELNHGSRGDEYELLTWGGFAK